MPLQIVRNDITKMKVDAIVNSTNEDLIGAGTGVDASIHMAAGPTLDEALMKLGTCPVGSAVITDSYDIPSCKYIIHTVTDFYDGSEDCMESLKGCYKKIFELTIGNGCKSVAMPVLGAGANGYPKELAYKTATSEARKFLADTDDDIEIYLVTFGKTMFGISRKLDDAISQYIDDNYIDENKERLTDIESVMWLKHRTEAYRKEPELPEFCGSAEEADEDFYKTQQSGDIRKAEAVDDNYGGCYKPHHADYCNKKSDAKKDDGKLYCSKRPFAHKAFHVSLPCEPEVVPPCKEDYMDMDLSFGDMCQWWVNKKGMKNGEFYTRANITKSLFYNLKNHPEKQPKKTTAFACAIGLGLDMDEAEDLLKRAGIAFSPYYVADLVVKYFIENKNYDIDEINGILYEKDQALLGSVM